MAATFLAVYIVFFLPILLSDLFTSNSKKLHPELQRKLQNAGPELMMNLAANQYKYTSLIGINSLHLQQSK